MPKDPVRNVDRYKVRGGHLNEFEYHQNQGAVSEQQQEHGNWMGAPEGSADLPPDKAKAERIRRLLAEHGESAPQTEERRTEEYEMEDDRTEEQRDTQSSRPASGISASENDKANTANAGERDFAPTHGRSPEVIREMMESRRATDRVPDPEDIVAGRPEQSQEKKEHGQTGRGTAARRTNKQPARAPKPAKAAKGKEAALDRSKPGVAKATSVKKNDKQSAPRKGTGQASAKASGSRAGKPSATTRGTKQAATSTASKQATSRKSTKAAAPKGGTQTAGRKDMTGASARNGARNTAGSKSAQSRAVANGRATTSATKSRRMAASTRTKSPAGRNR